MRFGMGTNLQGVRHHLNHTLLQVLVGMIVILSQNMTFAFRGIALMRLQVRGLPMLRVFLKVWGEGWTQAMW
jgi:hypothetical protein